MGGTRRGAREGPSRARKSPAPFRNSRACEAKIAQDKIEREAVPVGIGSMVLVSSRGMMMIGGYATRDMLAA